MCMITFRIDSQSSSYRISLSATSSTSAGIAGFDALDHSISEQCDAEQTFNRRDELGQIGVRRNDVFGLYIDAVAGEDLVVSGGLTAPRNVLPVDRQYLVGLVQP